MRAGGRASGNASGTLNGKLFAPSGTARPPGPGERRILLPILGTGSNLGRSLPRLRPLRRGRDGGRAGKGGEVGLVERVALSPYRPVASRAVLRGQKA